MDIFEWSNDAGAWLRESGWWIVIVALISFAAIADSIGKLRRRRHAPGPPTPPRD